MADEKITVTDAAPIQITVQAAGARGPAGTVPEPESVTTTLTAGVTPTLGTVNHWLVPSALTVSLPTNLPSGSTHVVHVDKIQNITWPPGSVVIGSVSTGEAWLTLVKETIGWSVLVPSNASGSGLPIFSESHPLFSPGSNVAGSIAAYNDFFGTSLSSTNLIQPSSYALFRYGAPGSSATAAGSTGALWLDPVSKNFCWGSFGNVTEKIAVGKFLRADPNGKVTYPLSGQASNAGVTPYIQTAYLAFLPPTDWRNATVGAASVPTAVNTVADLSFWANDSTTPAGVCILVASINKPVWKSTTGQFRDATGTQIFPVV